MTINTEEMMRAGNKMQHAADDMTRAASAIDYSLTQHQRFLDDWLQRFTQAIEQIPKETP